MVWRVPVLFALLGLFFSAFAVLAVPRVGDASLVDCRGNQTSLGYAFGDCHKLLLFTKPWADPNVDILAHFVHYRLRLNRRGIRSAVVFLRSDRSDAIRSLGDKVSRLNWFIDPEGVLAKAVKMRTLPALILVDPNGDVKYSTPLLSRDMVKQVASQFEHPDRLFPVGRPSARPRPGTPAASGGVGRYTIR